MDISFELNALNLKPAVQHNVEIGSKIIWTTKKTWFWLGFTSLVLIGLAEKGPALTSPWPRRADMTSPRRRALRRQPDCLDTTDSCSAVSSYSSSSHFHPASSSSATSSTTRRFRFHGKSAPAGSSVAQATPLSAPSRSDSLDSSPPRDQEGTFDEHPQFTSRGTFNPERGKEKLRGTRLSSVRNSRESEGQGRDPSDIQQQLVLYGSNEFMVWRALAQQSKALSIQLPVRLDFERECSGCRSPYVKAFLLRLPSLESSERCLQVPRSTFLPFSWNEGGVDKGTGTESSGMSWSRLPAALSLVPWQFSICITQRRTR